MEWNVSRQLLKGNLLLVICCIFYLAWWILAFRPVNPIKGFQSGWLLIPAAVCGIAGVILAVQGCRAASGAPLLVPFHVLVIAGVAAYVLLLLVTSAVFHRTVTTELVLIVGWTVLMLAELSAVSGVGVMGHTQAIALAAVAVIVGVASLICYVLYYNLGKTAGFWDGTLPLAFAAIYMVIITAVIK
ncbi:MAG: hypothetical protein ACI4XB_06440 [Ruminococcus sp.]